MESRSWRWLTCRIAGLLSKPIGYEPWTRQKFFATRLQAALAPPDVETPAGSEGGRG